MKDFFISYTGTDIKWAEWIAWHLEEAGYTTVIQAWDFRPGSNFIVEMQRASEEAHRTIAVLSKNYLKSLFTQPEWAAAFVKDPTGQHRSLLPIRIEECTAPGLLSSVVYIDLVGLDMDSARERLLAGVQTSRAKPDAPPAYPGRTGNRADAHSTSSKVWNVSHFRNVHFTGRTDILATLSPRRMAGSESQVYVLSGLGGIGKTQVAVEYCYTHREEYSVIWWLPSEEPVALAEEYAALSDALGLPERDNTDSGRRTKAVKQWLEQNPGWLLVFDNATDLQEIEKFMPRGGKGQILITSRNPGWGNVATHVSLEVLDREESVDLILKRIPGADRDDASALAELLGDLPLAIEQAVAYVLSTGRTLRDYCQLFEVSRRELLSRGTIPGYPYTVATTWQLAFERVEAESTHATKLMYVISGLAPDLIPHELLNQLPGVWPDLAANSELPPLWCDEAIILLQRYALVQARAGGVSVHRLVQTVLRDRLPEPTKREVLEASLRLVHAAFPHRPDDLVCWQKCAELLPHVLAVTDLAEQSGVSLPVLSGVLDFVGMYLYSRGQYPEAEGILQRAIRIVETNLFIQQEDPDLFPNLLHSLGLVYSFAGRPRDALEIYDRTVSLIETLSGASHINLVGPLAALASTLTTLAEYGRAKLVIERAITILDGHPDARLSSEGAVLTNIGYALEQLGDLSRALVYYRKALAVEEETYGPDHPKVATPANNIGMVLKSLGDLEGAKEHYERAVGIVQKAYGDRHPTVGVMVNNLGYVLEAMGEDEKARPYYEQALRISETLLGPDHPEVATRLSNLGSVLVSTGQPRAARELISRALEIDRKVYGETHPEVAIDLGNLGKTFEAAGDHQQAKACYQQAASILESIPGGSSVALAQTYHNLALVDRELGLEESAVLCHKKAIALFQEAYGRNHPDVAFSLYNLGQTLVYFGRLQQGAVRFKEALDISKSVHGPEHWKTGRLLHLLGDVHIGLNKPSVAIAYLKRALAIFEAGYPSEREEIDAITEKLLFVRGVIVKPKR